MIHPFEAGSGIEAGVDEVGRGCGAGPVVAAAVILPPKAKIPGLRDSKKLTASKRKELSGKIRELALDYSIAISTVEEIDQINILEATYLAMTRAIAQLKIKPDLLVIDGNRFKNQTGINHRTVVGGDDKVLSIAAASVLAKTWRDAYMEELHIEFPQYDWINNKGYLSTKHRQACFTHGLTPHHRKSFKGMTRQDDET
ncbi:MAG: ribonuclease HII [Saprospiraceae bacterium]|nr:ribonuclease HII [Candidatus Parvibacillus calidus]MBX2937385.1 ribonuclease HII [Saprospiraceae bacterium]MBX7179207.1 ribonuclease HII [Saprospiraceae bacterium]MCB0591706.1 ribonuclease HII [Saprospiraceae bacterium]MCC7149775.1 ribonuclease HII [Saprospiraceae bacterium]